MTPSEHCALITGASSGIGEATALAFAQAGIDLMLVSRSASKLEAVAEAARQFGVEVRTEAIDLAEIDQVRSRIHAIASEVGTIDILVNNAGMGYTGTLMETPLADWQHVIDLNLTSVFQVIQGALPTLRQKHRSTIINVASVAAHQAFPNWGAYCVSKFGLLALSKTLAAEERAHGIRVVTVSPGSVNTAIWDTKTVQADFDRSQMLTPDVVAQSILHAATMPPDAVVEEILLMPNAGTF
ncbi:SDR family oxidoreductase [Myxacorys almedinensis]|uniref:SDR family oxidoreductase n=1 Tax=Myxacorys almedinensis A TaxID=2690445 RepID=A0A8J8CLB9_9CYAN|nr:SDR family oxidoreductase [Myxacorys almedinensis]NDJ17600.1 SDR family oxidoreductase [Myxacorys almedinensis A]